MEEKPCVTDPTEPIEPADAEMIDYGPTERRPTLLLVDGYGRILRVSSRGAAE